MHLWHDNCDIDNNNFFFFFFLYTDQRPTGTRLDPPVVQRLVAFAIVTEHAKYEENRMTNTWRKGDPKRRRYLKMTTLNVEDYAEKYPFF